jgi:4-hydroxy-2-oxoglutarate aldolase
VRETSELMQLYERPTHDLLVVLAGTNGEAVTLSPAEKQGLVRATRGIALELGRKSEDFTITLGCGGQSTRDVIGETKQAADAGADYALVLVPSYFHFAMNDKAIIDFFEEVTLLWICTVTPAG